MSAGRLQLVCRATGERLPIEQLEPNGFNYTIIEVTTVQQFFVPYKAGSEPPACPPGATHGDVLAFFDEVNGKAIRDCLGVGIVDAAHAAVGG